jgi:hypothetical protein
MIVVAAVVVALYAVDEIRGVGTFASRRLVPMLLVAGIALTVIGYGRGWEVVGLACNVAALVLLLRGARRSASS